MDKMYEAIWHVWRDGEGWHVEEDIAGIGASPSRRDVWRRSITDTSYCGMYVKSASAEKALGEAKERWMNLLLDTEALATGYWDHFLENNGINRINELRALFMP